MVVDCRVQDAAIFFSQQLTNALLINVIMYNDIRCYS